MQTSLDYDTSVSGMLKFGSLGVHDLTLGWHTRSRPLPPGRRVVVVTDIILKLDLSGVRFPTLSVSKIWICQRIGVEVYVCVVVVLVGWVLSLIILTRFVLRCGCSVAVDVACWYYLLYSTFAAPFKYKGSYKCKIGFYTVFLRDVVRTRKAHYILNFTSSPPHTFF